jgi:diacylglycerol kinase family enzyme
LRRKPECFRDCSTCANSEKEKTKKQIKETKQITGKFLAVSSATLTCSCKHSPAGLSPAAHTGDGATDLIIVHNTSRLNYLRYLFRTALQYSSPFKLPFVEARRVRQFTFTPKDNKSSTSVWSCDGEILEAPAIAVKVHQQLIPVFARGVYRKNQLCQKSTKPNSEMKAVNPAQVFLSPPYEPDKICVV